MLRVVVKLSVRTPSQLRFVSDCLGKSDKCNLPLVHDAKGILPQVATSKVLLSDEESFVSPEFKHVRTCRTGGDARRHFSRWDMPDNAVKWLPVSAQSTLSDVDVNVSPQIMAGGHSSEGKAGGLEGKRSA